MTYKEAYSGCDTFEELEKMVDKDVKIAIFLNPDRIKTIENVVTEVCNEKGWLKAKEVK